jgi:neurofibromin 1
MRADEKRLQPVIQEHIWSRLAEKNEHLTDVVLAELMDAAMGGGMGSERAECVAEILHAISTTAIRGQLIARLRKVSRWGEDTSANKQTIAQTYLKPSAMLDQNPAWNEICVLARINLMLSFTPANPLGAQLFLPELIHIITLLVGIGPTLVRQTIYGLFINLLQSMASSKATDEMNATTLQQALDKAQQPVIMRCFGLVQLGSGLESLDEGTSKEESENSRLDRVETLAKFMGEILVAAAPSPGKLS